MGVSFEFQTLLYFAFTLFINGSFYLVWGIAFFRLFFKTSLKVLMTKLKQCLLSEPKKPFLFSNRRNKKSQDKAKLNFNSETKKQYF